MSVLYIIAGVNHLVHPRFYLKIMPAWVPSHSLLVLLSGIMEMALGMLLCIPVTRVYAAWGLIILLIAIFPANIQMMLNYRQQHNPQLWLAIIRLPLQILLIAWAYVYTKR